MHPKPKNEDPLVLGMALEMPQLVHFVARVVSCFGKKGAIPRSCPYRASDVTGISRKLRGSYGMGLGVLGHSFFTSVPVTK